MISEQSGGTLVSDYRLAPILVSHGSTLAFESERNTKPPNPRSSRHLGAATHVARLFGETAGVYSYTITDRSIRPTRPQNWFTANLSKKKRKVTRPHLAYTIRIEAPRSDADLNVFTAIEWADRNLWTFFKARGFHFTDDLTGPTSLQARFMAEYALKREDSLRIGQAYELRIEELRSYAEFDGLSINEASENDFWSFIMSLPFAGEAELVLLDNGNLRAIWDDDNGNHFGLQFLGDRELQYVIFRHRNGRRKISRAAGRDSFDGVKLQIQTFDLETLLHI